MALAPVARPWPWLRLRLPLHLVLWAAFATRSAQSFSGPTSFVIVTSKRSGGNFMIDMLHNHPHIEAGTAMLRNKNPVKSLPKANALAIINEFYAGQAPTDLVARKKQVSARGFKAVGKFQWGGISAMFAEHNVKVIFLWRRNLVRKMISQEAMHHGKNAHPESAKELRNVQKFKVELPTGPAFDQKMQFWTLERAQALEEYKGFSSISVMYEDLVATNPGCGSEWVRVLRFLGAAELPLFTRYPAIHAFMPLEDTVSNWPDVERHMASKGEYRWLLDLCLAEAKQMPSVQSNGWKQTPSVQSICGGVPVKLGLSTMGMHGDSPPKDLSSRVPKALLQGHHPPVPFQGLHRPEQTMTTQTTKAPPPTSSEESTTEAPFSEEELRP